jgi:hypothetical protein
MGAGVGAGAICVCAGMLPAAVAAAGACNNVRTLSLLASLVLRAVAGAVEPALHLPAPTSRPHTLVA